MLDFSVATRALQQGSVIAYPTESVYGLGCDPLCESAVLQLLALKKRFVSKGLLLIAADVVQIMPYIAPVSSDCLQQVLNTWPGPFTWVFPATTLVPPWIRGNHSTVAVRVTAHPIANALCAAFGRPIVSTSANLKDESPVCTAEAVAEIFPAGIEIIVPGKVGELLKPTRIRDAISGLIIR